MLKLYGCYSTSVCLAICLIANSESVENRDGGLVISRAVDALGGKKLVHLKARWSGELVFHRKDKVIGINIEVFFEFPDKLRVIISDGSPTPLNIIVVNGIKKWTKTGDGETVETKATEMESLSPEILLRLFLQQDKRLKISQAQATTIGDNTASRIEVKHPDYRSVSYYFDENTGMLLKTELAAKEDRGNRCDTTFFFDYRRSSGIAFPRRMESYKGGELCSTYKITSFTVLTAIDDSLFRKP